MFKDLSLQSYASSVKQESTDDLKLPPFIEDVVKAFLLQKKTIPFFELVLKKAKMLLSSMLEVKHSHYLVKMPFLSEVFKHCIALPKPSCFLASMSKSGEGFLHNGSISCMKSFCLQFSLKLACLNLLKHSMK